MKLHCLGTAGYHPCLTRQTSCYFIPEQSLMLDAGSGLFGVAPLVQSDCIHILLSHAHLDHVMGLTFLLDIFATTRLKSVCVYGERTKLDAVRQHLFAELIFPVMPTIQWLALEDQPKPFRVADATVRWFPLEHPGGSVGYRLDWSSYSLAYVTDTTADANQEYWDIVRGVDLLMHECNFTDEQQDLAIKTGHSWTSSVLECAAIANIRELLVCHLNPLSACDDPVGLADFQAANPNMSLPPIQIAWDGMSIKLGR